mmetsp:Transcript_75555/g.161908  ORF Transcript_75555/g.161908 Transcript_75555/m.161908 type:complete len:237 (+) Transcript_75555:349-1059(+)
MHLLRARVVGGLAWRGLRDSGPGRRRCREANVHVLQHHVIVCELELQDYLGPLRCGRGPTTHVDGQEGLIRGLELPLQERCGRVGAEGAGRLTHLEHVGSMRGLVQVGVHLVLEVLVLWSELEADQVRLRRVEHGDLELPCACDLALQATFDLEICGNLLLDLHLHRIEQRVHRGRRDRLWRLAHRLARRCRRHVCWVAENIARSLLCQGHALLRHHLRLDRRSAGIVRHGCRPGR